MNSFTNGAALRGASGHEFEPMFAPYAANSTPRKKLLTEDDVSTAHAEGVTQGIAEANAGIDRVSSDALKAIANMMQLMLGRLADEAHSLRIDATEVALEAAKAVATTALDAFGQDAILDIVTTAVAQLREAPRLVVRVSPELVTTIEERLIGCAREAGFSGEIAVRGDPAAQLGDCTLDWGDATIVHSRERAFAAIELAAKKWLTSAKSEGLQIDMFNT